MSVDETRDDMSTQMKENIRAAMYTIWYDFDSLVASSSMSSAGSTGASSSSPSHFLDWPAARRTITSATAEVIRATEEYQRTCTKTGGVNAEQKARERWTEEMKKIGAMR